MLRPLGARVLIKRLPLPDETPGGIILGGAYLHDAQSDDPDVFRTYDAREYPLIAEVLAVGPKVRDLEVGDMVQFQRRHEDEHDHLEGREVEQDTFIINYDHCLLGMRKEGDSYRVWPLASAPHD